MNTNPEECRKIITVRSTSNKDKLCTPLVDQTCKGTESDISKHRPRRNLAELVPTLDPSGVDVLSQMLV